MRGMTSRFPWIARSTSAEVIIRLIHLKVKHRNASALARVLKSGGDPVHRHEQDLFQPPALELIDGVAAQSLERVELDVRQGVDVRVAKLDSPRKDAMVLEQPRMAGHLEHAVDREVVFGKDAGAEIRASSELEVSLGNRAIRLG